VATLNINGFPDPVYRRIQRLAEQEHRSVAEQVIHMLSQAVTSRSSSRSIGAGCMP